MIPARRLGLLLLAAAPGCAGPRNYLGPTGGPIAGKLAGFGWVVLGVAMAVVVVVTALLVAAIARHRSEPEAGGEPRRRGRGLGWIHWGGMIIPVVILVLLFFQSLGLLEQLAAAPRARVTIRLTGHRWWWDAAYLAEDGRTVIPTANVLHIPAGEPVRLELETADVIHSFWIPTLAGKTDLVPGQHNATWIQADTPGTYGGQCGEYCGQQHANMMLTVIAEPRAEYERWLAAEAAPAVEPTDGAPREGAAVFAGRACAGCHTIRGTMARGRVGPDLTHLARRPTLAAGILANSPANLATWIAAPQAVKPGAQMPHVPLPADELQALLAYLQSLQ